VDRARALVQADSQGAAALAGHLGTDGPHDARFFAAAYGAAIVRLVTLLGVIDQLVCDRDSSQAQRPPDETGPPRCQ
jgi:hypothetical protein